MSPQARAPRRPDLTLQRQLYYMAPIDNVPSIAVRGILSYDAARRLRRQPISIADAQVNERRNDLILEGVPLHDFVPLYWATHTPMQYVITETRCLISQDELVFIEVNNGVLDLDGTWMSDGHAASSATSFYRQRRGRHEVDWKVVDTLDCYSKEYRRRKTAEVLVLNKVPVSYIARLCVRSIRTRARLRREINALLQSRTRMPVVPPIEITPELYY